MGWVAPVACLLAKLTKKGGHFNTDDMSIASSGPINAIFDNMKLTTTFGTSFAYRSPFTVIPAYMLGCGVCALLAAAAGLANGNYVKPEMVALFLKDELYTSFKQPHLTLGATTRGGLLLLFGAAGVLLGAALLVLLRELGCRVLQKKNQYTVVDGDIVLELREWSKHLSEEA
jgi:fructose-specific phosphotransferase system IIC component